MPKTGEDLVPGSEATLEPRLEAIYRRHHGFVWSSLLRLGVPTASLDDACQDVFLIVFRRLPDFEGRSRVRTWLFAITRRVAFRYRRGAQRAERKAKALMAEPPRLQSLDELFENRRAADLVLHALDGLDDDKRTAVVLHVLEGMSGRQIAEALGLPVDTAYSRIKAGRRMLRSRLEALGVDDDPLVYEAARHQTQPSPETRRRVAALLAARLGSTPVFTTVVLKGIAAAVAVGVIGWVGALSIGASVPLPTAAAVVAPAPEVPAPERSSAPRARPAPVIEIPPSAPVPTPEKVRPRAGSTSNVPAADQLREEVALIGGVKAALDAGRPADAMTDLDAHARRFPDGELTLERRGYRAIALCELGKNTEGRGAGRTFVKAHPQSTLAGRVRAACGLEEKSPGE